ncbi:alpha/beta hydrolase [Clostridiaceae bacterium M8S5]|nr:alpha/beta hydrolase [Clostridiaceae bacterium M8S5]
MHKKVLLILSGWAVDSFVWTGLVNKLAKIFKIYIISWNDVLTMDCFKNKVINIIKQNNIGSFSIIGWSLGSLVSIDIACSHLKKQIEGMILVSPTKKFIQQDLSSKYFGCTEDILKNMILSLKENPKRTINSFYKKLFSLDEIKKGFYGSFIRENHHNNLGSKNKAKKNEALILGLEYLLHKNTCEYINTINIPTMIIHGVDDRICPVEYGRDVDNHLKHSIFKEFSQTGHMPFFTYSDDFLRIVTNFFKGD